MAPKAADPKAKAAGKKKTPKAEKTEEDDGPKVEPPSKDEYEAVLAEIQKTIDDLQAQQGELSKQISGRSGGKEEYFAKRAEYGAQLDEFKKKIDVLMERKEGINKGIADKKQEGADMRNQLSKMKKSIGYTNETAIDDRIATIEFKLWTESVTLKQEKDYLKEISELKKSKPKVGQARAMEDSLASRDTGGNLRENIGTINEEMALYREGKKQVSQALGALNEQRKETLGDLPKLIEDRDALGKKIREQIDKRNVARDAYRAKEREYNAWRNEQRKKKQEQYQEEANKKKVEWESTQRQRKADSLDMQPHVAEITLLEQTIFFCKSLVHDKGPKQEEEKKEVSHDSRPEGTEILLSKDNREEEFYHVPTAAKKKGKSKNKGSKEGGSAKPIKHNAETFKLFDQLKLNAPITTEDIPATLEKLEAQLVEYQEKVQAWEVNKEEMKKKIMDGTYREAAKEEAAEEEEAAKEEAAEEEAGEEKAADE